jgi:hypothetical protein
MGLAVVCLAGLAMLASSPPEARAYPPAVGILGKAKNCMACHVNNGPWKDDAKTIIEVLDADTKKSLRQDNGSFLIEAKRGMARTVLTVIGRGKGDAVEAPYRNAWLYLDPTTVESAVLSKFAPGWDVNLPMSCRLVGDLLAGFEEAKVSVLPMTIRPTDAARDGELILQVMLTKGEAVKGKAREGMIGSYFERKVRLKVVD